MTIFGMLALPIAGWAVLPENGLYWDSAQPGKGFSLEIQNGTGVLIIYAGSPDTGKPEYYIAAGEVTEKGFPPTLETPPDFGGLYPVHGFSGDLYALSVAPCLTCLTIGSNDVEYVAGKVEVVFVDRNNLVVTVDWNEEAPPLIGSLGRLVYTLRRMDFAYPWSTDVNGTSWYYDLRGEWIFTDETDPMRAPWRFQFTQMTPGIDTSHGVLSIPTFDYVDPKRNATLHCLAGYGCSVSVDGNVLFAMNAGDIGLDSILAYLGPYQFPGGGVYRGTQTVIGLRIAPQPVQAATSGP